MCVCVCVCVCVSVCVCICVCVSVCFRYKQSWQWADGSIAFYMRAIGTTGPHCAVSKARYAKKLDLDEACNVPLDADYLCEFQSLAKTGNPKTSSSDTQISLPSLPLVRLAVPHVKCPDGHVTQAFLACDEQSACWLRGYGYVESEVWGVPSTASCPAPMTSLPAMFTCSSGGQRVSYSMVCDHRQQCGDGSDESFCVFPPCSDTTPLQCGTSTQVHKREGGR